MSIRALILAVFLAASIAAGHAATPTFDATSGPSAATNASSTTTVISGAFNSAANGVIIVVAGNVVNGSSSVGVSGVSDDFGTGLTWHCRLGSGSCDKAGASKTATPCSDFATCTETQEVWWTFSSGAVVSKSITVTWASAPAHAYIYAFAVNGAFSSTAPFDPNASLPAWAGISGTSNIVLSGVTTTNANDFLFSASQAETGLAMRVCDAGWTHPATPGDGGWVQLQLTYIGVTAIQSALTVNYNRGSGGCPEAGISTSYVVSVDAITGDSSAPSRGGGWQMMK